VRTTHDSPSRVDWAGYQPLSDHDEHALEAIRRQLDMEFPHFSGTVVMAPPVERPHHRRGWAATALGLLLTGGGFAATVVSIMLYQALTTPPVVERVSAPATITPAVAATPPAATAGADTSMKRPSVPRASTEAPSVQQVSTKPHRLQQANSTPVRPVPDVIRLTSVPDVIRVTEAKPARREAAALPAAPPVAAPPSVEHIVSTAPAPIPSPAPAERPLAAGAPTTLVQRTSEHARSAWATVKERVVRSPGEIAQASRVGADAP